MSGSRPRMLQHGNDAARRAHFIVGDPIRGVAALLIFVFHVALAALFVSGMAFGAKSYDAAFGSVGGKIVDNAELGVYAFFALSGYLIGRPFVHAYLRGERRPNLPRHFRRRVLRIMPAFLLVVTLALIRFGSIDASAADLLGLYALAFPYDVTPGVLQQGVFGHLWTVSAEMGFYLLLPVAMIGVAALAGRRLDFRGRLVLLVVLLTAAALASLAFRHLAPHTVGYARWLPSVLFAFVPGIALAALEAFVPARATARPGLARVCVVVLLGAGLAFCAAFGTLADASPAILGTCATLGPSALIAAALLEQWSRARAWRVLDNRPLHWLGARAYSFYLVHVPILWDIQFRLDGRIDNPKVAFVVLFGLAFTLSAAFAALAFRFVERPCMEMDDWPWRRGRQRSAVAAEQTGLIPPEPDPALVPER